MSDNLGDGIYSNNSDENSNVLFPENRGRVRGESADCFWPAKAG